MQLIDEWRATLKKSYTAWLGFIALACTMALGILNMAPPGTIPPHVVASVTPWITYIGLIAGSLVPGGRVVRQAGLPNK
jgi:hypothetical protein